MTVDLSEYVRYHNEVLCYIKLNEFDKAAELSAKCDNIKETLGHKMSKVEVFEAARQTALIEQKQKQE